MVAWIESIAGLMSVGRIGLDFSLSDARYLLPHARIWGILVVYAAFCMFCIWDDTQPKDRQDQESDTESK